ncbi:MAG: hypothetical protein L6R36_001220 [Xanthoria steineri]|nr:MAG: hypothetical protein L6R36_001220 [Xanthoria steineri]
MAKDRAYPAPGGKTVGFTSTSAIFKKHKSHVQSKDERRRPMGLQSPSIPTHSKRKHRPEHPLLGAFSDNVHESRQKIEEGTKARLANVRDALVSQTHSTVLDVQDRLQKDHSRSKDLQRPLDDELLEITRQDGTVVTMTLGKRIDAYRRLVHREKQNLNSLFEQWQQVSREINTLATELLGSEGSDNILKGIDAVAPDFDGVEQRALTVRLEAERERAQAEAAAIGAKAVKQMKTGEKASSRPGNFPYRLID